MPIPQLSQKRGSEHTIQLSSIERPSVLSRPLKRVESGIEVAGLAGYCRARCLMRGGRAGKDFDFLKDCQ